MTFPDIQKIWKEVERRTSKQNRAEIPTLRNFLIQNLDNPHARVLTGYSVGSLADAKSVEALQALIINKHRNSRAKLSQWLGICHVALDEMCRHGYPVPLSDLAPYLPPSPSPFASLIPLENSQTTRHPPSAKAILSWRDSLNRWIRTKAEHAQRNEWNAAILLSAIIHGALLDNIKIKLLLKF